jgi:HD-GYP domain-containing protein (c-di-GMP phosphodiesterase class II)
VVAVADGFDAMTTGRPYRPPRSVADALEELRRGAGAQWDGAMVDALHRRVPARIAAGGLSMPIH